MLNDLLDIYSDEDLIIADGFDDAIIGIDDKTMRVIYSVSKCLTILEKNMSPEDAQDYFDFNISGSHMGDKTPIWCVDNF